MKFRNYPIALRHRPPPLPRASMHEVLEEVWPLLLIPAAMWGLIVGIVCRLGAP